MGALHIAHGPDETLNGLSMTDTGFQTSMPSRVIHDEHQVQLKSSSRCIATRAASNHDNGFLPVLFPWRSYEHMEGNMSVSLLSL
jgi:hypothetical protein